MRFPKILAAMAAAAIVAIASGCSGNGPRTVEYPIVNYGNTSSIDITEVELTDTATILNINAHYRPGWWIRIASGSCLEADGKKYALTGTDGITPDSEFFLPESGEADFKLIFEPLPFSTKRFDFIEGDAPGAFRLLGVDLTGKPASEYPEGLPREMRNHPASVEVPEPAFEIGTTTVNVHMLPYIESLAKGNLYVNTLSQNQDEYTLDFDSTGVATVSFEQYGPATAFVVIESSSVYFGTLHLYPGETLDTYIDMRRTGQNAMRYRDKDKQGKSLGGIHNGRYSDFDHMVATNEGDKYFGLQLYSGEFGDYHMSGPEFKELVRTTYMANADSINAQAWPEGYKEYQLLKLQDQAMEAMADFKGILIRNYCNTKDAWREKVPADSIPAELTDADFAEVATWFDISNPKLAFVGESMGEMDWNKHAGAEGDLSRSINLFVQTADKAINQKVSRAELDSLKYLSDHFFAAAIDSIAVRAKRLIDQLRANATPLPTPDYADDKVFDAIIAPHKGKVVMVDLWNTWCGPCRMALAQNEPLKSGELADDDIVWIYIADESSDPVKYLEMIPGIKGLHYKVNEAQIKAIRDRFKVDGIPYYILVDRNGKAEGRPDLRDHDKYISEIKSKL